MLGIHLCHVRPKKDIVKFTTEYYKRVLKFLILIQIVTFYLSHFINNVC